MSSFQNLVSSQTQKYKINAPNRINKGPNKQSFNLCSSFHPRPWQDSQMPRFYSRVSRKRPQSAAVLCRRHKALWFRARFFSPLSSNVCLENQQGGKGTPPTIYAVNTQPLAVWIFAKGKNLCECHQTSSTRPFTGRTEAGLFSSQWLLFFVSLSTPVFLPFPLQWTCWRNSMVRCFEKGVSIFFFYSYFSGFFIRFMLSLKCCVRRFCSPASYKMPSKVNTIVTLSDLKWELFDVSDTCSSKQFLASELKLPTSKERLYFGSIDGWISS